MQIISTMGRPQLYYNRQNQKTQSKSPVSFGAEDTPANDDPEFVTWRDAGRLADQARAALKDGDTDEAAELAAKAQEKASKLSNWRKK